MPKPKRPAVSTPEQVEVQKFAKAVAKELDGILHGVIHIPPRGPSSGERLESLLVRLRHIANGGKYELD